MKKIKNVKSIGDGEELSECILVRAGNGVLDIEVLNIEVISHSPRTRKVSVTLTQDGDELFLCDREVVLYLVKSLLHVIGLAPMSEAPRDGTDILVKDGVGLYNAVFSCGVNDWYIDGHDDVAQGLEYCNGWLPSDIIPLATSK